MSEAYDWPVLRRYDVDHQLRVAMPIGGIGTGSVSLGGRGDLRDWELENSPRKGFAPRHSFFAIRAEDPVGGVTARVLQGPIDPTEYEGAHGSVALQHGLPRFRHSEFLAAYPLGQVELSDRDVPVSVRLQAFNPLIPTDADASGIPVAVFRYLVTNQSDRPLQISVVGNVGNLHDAPFAAREATRVGGVASEDGKELLW